VPNHSAFDHHISEEGGKDDIGKPWIRLNSSKISGGKYINDPIFRLIAGILRVCLDSQSSVMGLLENFWQGQVCL